MPAISSMSFSTKVRWRKKSPKYDPDIRLQKFKYQGPNELIKTDHLSVIATYH